MLIQEPDEVRPVPADRPAVLPPAAPVRPAGTPLRSAWVPDAITMPGGLLCVAVGLAVMVAWLVRATPVLRFGSQTPMTFNTALAFVVTGAALIALARGHPRATLAAGLFDVTLGVVVLAEYASGHSLGIDQLVVKAYITGPHDVPERMALNTVVCVALAGAGLLAWGPWRLRRRPAVLAAAGSLIAVVAVEASLGYATGDPVAYSWTPVTAMAFLTAVTLLILALSLLSAAWRDSRVHRAGLPWWLPMPAGALALGLGIWLVINGRAVAAGRISAVNFTIAASVLGLVAAGLVVVVVSLAQHAEGRGRAAREGEHRLFQFLHALPVAVFIALPDSQPYPTLLGFLEINRDITARKDAEREIRALNATLEQRVQQRTVHLERANIHLAAFTYSAAHDLRTPLREISGYAEALIEEYGDQLDDTGRGYTRRIQAASEQMAAALDAQLNLSRVSRATMNLQDVDLSAEATAICGQLRAADPGRQIQITVEDGVRATADRPLIRTVLEQLLDNAWKFTGGREEAAIEFATTPVDDAPLCCYVRDNRAGFDPAYTHKLFRPFRRLHDTSQFSGTGIGLAIVQRIIDRHGGRTWAEGTVGRGATTYFTLDATNAS